MLKYIIILTALLCFCIPLSAQQTYTYTYLISRLTDLEALAVLPAGEKCQQWSSYDRKSYYDEETDTYMGWAENNDGFGYIRQEGDELVIAEMVGPGVIWRIWTARAESGPVKIYLDENPEPVIDLPFMDYFSRQHEPFIYSELVHQTASGLNAYLPVSFQRSCQVRAEGKWGAYYHFTYTTFPRGTIVPTFNGRFSAEESAALKQVNSKLQNCGASPYKDNGRVKTLEKTLTIAPGKKETFIHLQGTQAITAFKIKIKLPESPQEQILLRQLSLSIYWDNEAKPSVWCPLGDFFGTAPGVNEYRSLPLGMTAEDFYSYWYMPFEKDARIEIINESDQEQIVTVTAEHRPLQGAVKQYGRFHAKWHRNRDIAAKRPIDWTILKTKGQGRYCGVMLHVWNPRGDWWGEGDEKFFVDNEKFPSTFGTGSEDYFGYAWCNPSLFQHAFHNQTISMNNKGHVSVNRWHIADNVPFQNSFEAGIEKYFPDSRPTLYDCVAYWYLDPAGTDDYEPVAVQDRLDYWEPVTLFRAANALEGERLKIISRTAGQTMNQDMNMFCSTDIKWSCQGQLWWIDAKPGDKLKLSFSINKAGQYRILMNFTKAVDYGIFQLYLDDRKLAEPIDLYDTRVIPTGELDMGTQKFAKGEHYLIIEIIGANPQALKRYMFGLDYLRLE